MVGWIYVLACDKLGLYKIGRTNNLRSRLRNLSIQLPYPVRVLGIIPSPDAAQMERMLHDEFADKRLNGEWFSLNDQDIEDMQCVAELGFSACPDEMMAEGLAFADRQESLLNQSGLPTLPGPSADRED